jgi:glycosyltransferase involved in cell wall biosynthesis
VTVSVLTPSFGYGRFIRDAIVSVRLQGNGISHVVQDGGSTDETIEILSTSEGVDWRSEPDAGQSDALNRALQRASGEWVAWLNADEFYLPGGIEALVQEGERTGADVVYGDCVFVDDEGRFLRLVPQHPFSGTVLRRYGCFIATVATVFRRTALPHPWVDPNVERIMDWDLFLRLRSRGASFVWVPRPIGAFRVHPGRITAQPVGRHAASFRLVEAQHGVYRPRSVAAVGRAEHALRKLLAGSYHRQVRARRLRGRDFRWFATEEGRRAVEELLAIYHLRP